MFSPIHSLLLGMQRALLDAVTPQLRAVILESNSKEKIQSFLFYYDGEITGELFDLASIASTEASCSLDYSTNEQILRLDYPQKIPAKGRFAYLRYESNPSSFPIESYIELLDKAPLMAFFLLGVQQALLGRVTPNLRSVTVDVNNSSKILSIFLFYHGEISHTSNELAQSIVQTLKSIFPVFEINKSILRVDYPEKIPKLGKRYAYARKED